MARHHLAFTPEWFRANLSRLCRAFNAPLLGRWMRRGLGLQQDGRVVDVRVDSIVIETSPGHFEYTGWTGDVVAQFVYDIAKPLWWAIHYWDEWIADRWIPQLSYGFSTLTAYTQSRLSRAYDATIVSIASSFVSTYSQFQSTKRVIESTDQFAFPLELYFASYDSSFEVARSFANFDTSPIAGVNGQYRPGMVEVTSAQVRFLIGATSRRGAGAECYLVPSRIDPSRTGATLIGPDYYTPLRSISLAPVQDGTAVVYPFQGNLTTFYYGYVWDLAQTSFSEITSFYYPPSIEQIGQHNGLARFAVIYWRDFGLGNGNTTSFDNDVEQIPVILTSHETASGLSQTNPTVLQPRLVVQYTTDIVIDPSGIPSATKFGTAQVTGGARTINLAGRGINLNVNGRFGTQTNVLPLDRTVTVQGIKSGLAFGYPIIPLIQPQGIPSAIVFGAHDVFSPLSPLGIDSTLAFGAAVVTDGQVVRPTPFAIGPVGTGIVAGTPFVEREPFTLRPVGIASTLRIGRRVFVGNPFPPDIYVSRLIDLPLEYRTTAIEYEGGRVDTNVQICGMRRWRLEYEGLSRAELDVLVAHFNSTKGQTDRFSFYHRRDDAIYDGVRYVGFDIPVHIKAWNNAVSITLERQEL